MSYISGFFTLLLEKHKIVKDKRDRLGLKEGMATEDAVEEDEEVEVEEVEEDEVIRLMSQSYLLQIKNISKNVRPTRRKLPQ